MPTISELILRTPLGKAIQKSVAAQLTTGLRETDSNFYPGGNMSLMYRDRYDYDRQTILAECLRAWRVNPIARRIVKLISMFVVGEGIQIKSDHKATQDYLNAWWNHPLNRLSRKVINFCDENTRSGNLFFLCSIDQANGMLYVRGVPADQVEEIVSAENDVDQELAYKPVTQGQDPWPAYDRSNQQESFMLHYACNQPVGVAWGEPDLAPMLPWIGRYSSWLEDRARLNRFRQAFMFILRGKFTSTAERLARQKELNANPPPPGSILVTDESESWGVLSPELASFEAGEDGLALKKMIAIGAGIPPHYLAEPESSTRSTAEAAGTPTFRGLEQTQTFFLDILSELAQLAVQHRKKFDRRVNPASKIEAIGPDITERDNSMLSLAVSRIYPAMSELFDREGIDETELLRIVYRMAGEIVPVPGPQSPVRSMKRRPLKPVSQQPTTKGSSTRVGENDPASAEPKEPQ
ncbi:MAG: hypothetical protein D4R38_02700 [Dehalococcoidia bacterium]|nr:MAG: hypothetical protein D4R38_02700 [Dehalococcoidia bacterium]